jgi:hypothetical protein
MIVDGRRPTSYSYEVLSDGMRQIGHSIGGDDEPVPVYTYYGPNAVVVNETKYYLVSPDDISGLFSLLESADPTSGAFISNVDAGGELIIMGGSKLVTVSITTTKYPAPVEYVPPPQTSSTSYSNPIVGYTIDGTPIKGPNNKGTTISTNYTSAGYIDKLSGSMAGPSTNIVSQLTSFSRSNGRIINGELYYDYSESITYYG